MAVGLPLKTTYANGDVYSASDVNDTNGTINITAAPYAAGKNKFINGAFDNWQRGTSISLTSGVFAYTVDRFLASCSFSAGTSTVSRQAFTPGTAPVSGYEGNYFARLTCGSTTSVWNYRQNIENVTTFAGQTATLSFWIKASAANATTSVEVAQIFGSGGSGNVVATYTGPSVTTSWQRFSLTVNIPSIAGKTIGTSSYLSITLYSTTGIASSLLVDTWGWQMEAGSTATAFQTATGTIQGELAACQRYYWRNTTGSTYGVLVNAAAFRTTTAVDGQVVFPVPMRINPTSMDWSGWTFRRYEGTTFTTTLAAMDANTATPLSCLVSGTVSGGTAGQFGSILSNNTTSGYIGFSAEL
jgi:hypothetical protein